MESTEAEGHPAGPQGNQESPTPLPQARNAPRTTPRWATGYVAALIAIFAAAAFGPSLLGFRVLLTTNLMSAHYPFIVPNGLQLFGHYDVAGDTIDAVMSGVGHIRAELALGHLAWWQSVLGGGGSLLSQPDLGLLNPLSWPYWVLPLWLAPAFVAASCFACCLIGTYLFLRRHQLARHASLLAGFVFATSGFMVMWTNWPQTRVAAFIPLLFWSVERLLQRQRATDLVAVALMFASMLLGGFPAITGWAIYFVLAYAVVRLIWVGGRNGRVWFRCGAILGGGLLAGLGLSAVQLLPFLNFYRSQPLGYRTNFGAEGLPFVSILTVISAHAFSLGVYGNLNYYPMNMTLAPFEYVAYVGAAALVIALIGAAFGASQSRRVTRGLQGFAISATLILGLLIWGPSWVHHLANHLPVFAGNKIGRISESFAFSLAILVGLGFERLTSNSSGDATSHPTTRRQLIALVVMAGFVVVVFFAATATVRSSARGQWWWPEFTASMHGPVVLVLIAAVVAGSVWRWPAEGRVVALVVLPVLVVSQSSVFFRTVQPGDARSNFFPVTPIHAYLQQHLGENRYAASGLVMYPSTSLFYGLRTPTGHIFYAAGWENLLKAVDPKVFQIGPTFADFSKSALTASNAGRQPILDQMGVTEFVQDSTSVAGRVEPPPSTRDVVSLQPGQRSSCTIAGGPLRGLVLRVTGPVSPAHPERQGTSISVVVHSGTSVATGGTFILGRIRANTSLTIPVAGEALGSAPATATVIGTGFVGHLSLASLGGAQNPLACGTVRPIADELRVVFASPGGVIYQRLTALPRVRWASDSRVIIGQRTRIDALSSGIGPNSVLLDQASPAAEGGRGRVALTQDLDGHLTARTSSTAAGYVVFADSLQQPGWQAAVDGRAVPLVPADEAFGAVWVPAGAHTVTLNYAPPGLAAGFVISVITALGLAGLVGWSVWRRRRGLPAKTVVN